MFGVSQVAVLTITGYTYARTDSLLAPALAYASVRIASRAVAVFLEAGLQSW